MEKELLEKCLKKLERDYTEICEEYLKYEKKEIIKCAFALAHYNEIVDFFDYVDSKYPPFDEEVFESIVECEENVIEKIYNNYLGYNHPERYNFFTYEDLVDIIRYTFL